MAIVSISSKTLPTALIIHGWNDNPGQGWLGWIGRELQGRGYTVHAPHMRIDERPLLVRWSEQVRPFTQELIDNSIIVAHSLGCFIALRELEAISLPNPVGTVILVSGFYDAPNESASKFFSPEPDWEHIRSQASRFICVASSDDSIVTPDRTRRLAHKLDAELVMLADKGHFLGSRGMETLPELLDFIG